MATLALSAVGTALGGPFGGAIGALVGRQVDFALLGGGSARGPRLQDLSVQTSTYGAPIPLQFGTMRVAGSVIWATDLVEHSQVSGGKAQPTVTRYSYTVSLAVALSSRPIEGIGRIWADGNLLRGAAGDLKVGGQLRVHTGFGDQPLDPLLAQAEGVAHSPAYRHTAYVVFEDLELAAFGNRIPSLTFEVFADAEPLSLGKVVHELVPDAQLVGLNDPIVGFSVDRGSAADTLDTITQVRPLVCHVVSDTLTIAAADAGGSGTPVLPQPAAGGPKSDEVRATGWSRRREALPRPSRCAVRYYDVDRDFQPGLQQSIGCSTLGDVSVIDFPAALLPGAARQLAQAASRRRSLPADTLRYRITEIDPATGPGTMVSVPVSEGRWRIDQWEWQADGVLLELSAVPYGSNTAAPGDPGRSLVQPDNRPSATVLDAFELPWDGSRSDTPAIYAAASAAGPGWAGAALLASHPGGAIVPLGSTGRGRATSGTVTQAPAAASPHLLDRINSIEVVLAGPDLALSSTDFAGLAQGANLALIGNELVQFATVEWLAPDHVHLRDLLRGRGGSEWAIAAHQPGERFVLIENLVALDQRIVGDAASAEILAAGIGDGHPVSARIRGAGTTARPLSPVHGHASRRPDGSIEVSWTRRARGFYAWPDRVEVPLNEQAERYEVVIDGVGPAGALRWLLDEPSLTIDSITALELANTAATTALKVSQLGNAAASFGLSVPLPA